MAQLNDLLVTGNSRFLNEINGKIDWLNINNKPTIIGTVTQVKVGSTTYDPTSGVISLPAYPSVPVTSVAGKTGAVTLTASDVGALASTTKYAGASTAGGSATSAAKLDTATAGSATQPCYFSNGVPSACTYSLNKTVPSDAVFTDTKVTSVDNHYTPTAASTSKITITSTGGYPKKIEISRDAKGHVTGATVTETEAIPDNDFNVTQTESSANNNYEVTFSGTASTATKTEGVGKSAGFIYNPSKQAVTVGSRNSSTVIGNYSSVFGENCEASGDYSHAEGTCTQATTVGAHAEGYASSAKPHIASGLGAHVEGYGTTLSSNTASGDGSHAEGFGTVASGECSHAEGYRTTASFNFSHAEGGASIASGMSSHAEGLNTTASNTYSHAEGFNTEASGKQSHAEGYGTKASGMGSHAEGTHTTASGVDSHAEGLRTIASGDVAHTEGYYTTASGNYSHAEGSLTIANHRSQHVFGELNLADASTVASTDRGNYIEIVGNGLNPTQLSNARTLDWDGNEWLAGKLEASYFVAASTYTGGEAECRITPNFVRVVERITEGSSTTGVTTELQSDDIYSSSTWDGTNQYLKSALADKVNKSQLLHTSSSGYVGIDSIRCGTMISNFTNGSATISFASLGLTTRPEVMLLTCQSQKLAMEYDFDSSTTAITLKLVGSTMSGNVRYSWMIAVKGS